MPEISVCMAVKNGAAYLREQISTILPQLAGDDELIISNDHSTDDSLGVIQGFNDPRIRIIHNAQSGVVSNFENALRAARGRFIFLADQDDVWASNKVAATRPYLDRYELVVSDSTIVDENLSPKEKSFYSINRSGKGLLRNVFRNSYMGCCMAFQAKVLEKALPFPKKIPMHDVWIGLICEIYFSVKFVDSQLVLHRRHAGNASTTSRKSNAPMSKRLAERLWLMRKVIELKYAS